MTCKYLCNLCWLLCFGFMEDFFTESFNLCLGLALGRAAWEKPYSFFFGCFLLREIRLRNCVASNVLNVVYFQANFLEQCLVLEIACFGSVTFLCSCRKTPQMHMYPTSFLSPPSHAEDGTVIVGSKKRVFIAERLLWEIVLGASSRVDKGENKGRKLICIPSRQWSFIYSFVFSTELSESVSISWCRAEKMKCVRSFNKD